MIVDYYLGEQQNAVTNTDLDGNPVKVHDQIEEKPGFWSRIKRAYYKGVA